MTFDRNVARPILDDGQSYVLVVEQSDGSELKMCSMEVRRPRPIQMIVVVR
jgi:hypothetical protein